MKNEQLLKLYLAQQNNSQRVEQREIKPNQVQPDLSIRDVTTSVGGAIGLVTFWAVFLVSLSKLVTNARNYKLVLPTNPMSKVPCRNCQYFSNNHYLSCAVQPDIVMSERAMNCSDYCPKKGSGEKMKNGE